MSATVRATGEAAAANPKTPGGGSGLVEVVMTSGRSSKKGLSVDDEVDEIDDDGDKEDDEVVTAEATIFSRAAAAAAKYIGLANKPG